MLNGTDSLISVSTSNLSRRRARSQILYEGDSLNTLSDQNKQLVEDILFLKKVNLKFNNSKNYWD